PSAIGANLDGIVRDEVNGAKDKELQLEVGLSFAMLWKRSMLTSAIGRGRLPERLHSSRFAVVEEPSIALSSAFCNRSSAIPRLERR
ncbi:UNVERIFIED_CONTAM: hypothetical protein NY603_31265, partial [Bacteroidetes bacterium 56_B9]